MPLTVLDMASRSMAEAKKRKWIKKAEEPHRGKKPEAEKSTKKKPMYSHPRSKGM